MNTHPLHITVGTSALFTGLNTGPQLLQSANLQAMAGSELEHELQVLKAALLYGDKVKLCGTASAYAIAYKDVTEMPEEYLFDLAFTLTQLVNGRTEQELLAAGSVDIQEAIYNQVIKARKGIPVPPLDDDLVKVLRDGRPELIELFYSLMPKKLINELTTAMKSGMAEIVFFESSKLENQVLEYIDIVSKSLASSSTYPLFDESLARFMAQNKLPDMPPDTNISQRRTRQIALAADLLKKLPLFEKASVSEILDIRKELEIPLVRFRGVVAGYAAQMEGLPWSLEFEQECEEIFLKEIAPAIADIDDAYKSNHNLTNLALGIGDALTTAPVVATSAFGVAIAHATQLPEIIGLMPGIALAGLKAVKEWKEKNAEFERNQLYFYYRAGQILKR